MSLKLNAEILTWKEARDIVFKVNPELALAIDELSPSDEYKLIRARYPFGRDILKNGDLQLPSDKGNISIKHPDMSPEVRKLLEYAPTMPMGIVIDKSIELYFSIDHRIIPFSSIGRGKIFALWGILDISETAHLGKIWSMMAGTRSLYMLPKISDAENFKKIDREFNVAFAAPNNLSDQWKTFSTLANHPSFPKPWYAEVIYFSGKWLENDKDVEWRLFRNYLMKKVWKSTSFLRNQVVFDFAFSMAQVEENLKPNPYLSDICKHLYHIGTGSYPGFIIANDDRAAPVSTFQDLFANIYGLKYVPIMTHPGYFMPDEPLSPCYYALQCPTLLDFSPKSKKVSSKLNDLIELTGIMSCFMSYIVSNKLGLESTPIYKWAKSTGYSYFHTDSESNKNIMPTKDLFKMDNSILNNMNKFSSLSFPENSPFFRGCIRVSSN